MKPSIHTAMHTNAAFGAIATIAWSESSSIYSSLRQSLGDSIMCRPHGFDAKADM